MVLVLTHAVCLSVLCPIPVPGLVAPPPPLSRQDVAGIAVELDHGPGGEGESRLSAVRGRRQHAAGYDCQEKNNIVSIELITLKIR